MVKKPKTLPTEERKRLQEQIPALIEHTIRFTTLANAGGIAATMTVLGATAKDGDITNILAVPLALFALGVVCALLLTFHTTFSISGKIKESTPPNIKALVWIRPWLKKNQDLFFYGGPACFVAGTVVGVIIVLFA